MAESVKYKLRFPAGKQKEFLQAAQTKLAATNAAMAKLCGVSVRTWTDWRREKFLLSVEVAQKIATEADLRLPRSEKVEEYWYAKIGAKLGAAAVQKRYGGFPVDEDYRKEKWRQWWEEKGKFSTANTIGQAKDISEPPLSAELAEFVGIMMGDGGISRYQAIITLHAETDLAYSKFVKSLIKKLFKVPVAIRKAKNANAISLVVSRIEFVKFCKHLGLPIGDKIRQNLDIPAWIMENPEYQIACLRGLVDTDGSIFTHRYKVGGKWYAYRKLDFCTASPCLRKSAAEVFKNIGIKVRMAGDRKIRIDSIHGMKQYFRLVSSNNPKHLNRYTN